jgi:DNA-binding XRE family transcriptional regulator
MEREGARPAGEIRAMWHAIEKLMSEGAASSWFSPSRRRLSPISVDSGPLWPGRPPDGGPWLPKTSGVADNKSDIVTSMDLSKFKRSEELLAEDLASDPGFRAAWERTALARAVAIAIVRYRGEHGLSQRALAERVGMSQPQVARLELGEYNPRVETLLRLSSRLGLEFTIEIQPGAEPRLVVAAA